MNTDPASLVALGWWVLVMVVGGVLAAMPVNRPPAHRAIRACRVISHAARHLYARLWLYRGR